jgi:hypothetical protein
MADPKVVMAKDVGLDYRKFTVTFSCDGVPDVIALLDQTPVQVMGGHGGWQVTSRERRIGLTQWRGNDPIRLAVPILFDSNIHDISKQSTGIRHLQLMGRPPKINDGEPPIITVVSEGIRYPTSKGSKQEWVIENMQWGTNVMMRDYLRQDVVVNLIEYIDEDRVAFAHIPTISKHRHKKPKHPTHQSHKDPRPRGKSKAGWPKFYHPMPGDTLPKIAAKFYHDSSNWHRIATANHIRDPRLQGPLVPWLIIIPAP